jgi:predicted short-subunit dehydrogenase-like oxidoreductase (DUF2520 family)
LARRSVVSVVGCGRVGGAIGLALQRAGYTVAAAWSRSRAGRQRAHRILDVPVLDDPAEVAGAGDVVFVAVPDEAIAGVAEQLAPGLRSRAFVLHTSGGTSVKALAAAAEAGARIASTHPLQTIPDAVHGADALHGAAVAVTCAQQDRLDVFRIARAWGGRPFLLADDAKPRYHAAAVFASNFVVGSVWAATALLRQVGVRDTTGALAPLLQSTVGNIVSHGPEKSLTGPIVRGDVATIRGHVEALTDAEPEVLDAYRCISKLTAHLAGLDAVVAEAL